MAAPRKTAKKTETDEQTEQTEQVAKYQPKIKRTLVLPLLKKADDVPIYIRIEGEIHTGKEVKGVGDKAKMAPARLVNCMNLETGELCQIIVNKVLEETLIEHYPDGGYVGLGFEIIQHQVEGKRYKTYTVNELEL